MKLLSAYIKGFGKFQNFQIDLSKDVIQIKQDNGWGKSTFADFIECMFYGMDEGRKKSIAENFRVKYKPWDTDIFGGTLQFTAQGKVFRVERTFGKTPAFDTVKIYEGNYAPTFAFGDKGERLGETLFGVDRESYRRSVYLPQGIIPTDGFLDDVKGKLSALLTAESGNSRQKDSITLLDEAERALRSKRAPKTGKLDKIDEEIISLKTECAQLRYAIQSIESLQTAAKEERARYVALQEKWEETDRLITARSSARERATGVTLRKEIEEVLHSAEEEFRHLQRFFKGMHPHQVNVDGLAAAITEYYTLKEECDILQAKINEKGKALSQKERLQLQMQASEKQVETYRTLMQSQENRSKKDKKEEKKQRQKAGRKGGLALICVCLGIGVLLFGLTQTQTQETLGYILSGIGLALTLISAPIFWKNTLKSTNADDFSAKQVAAAYKKALDEYTKQKAEYDALCESGQDETELSAQYSIKKERLEKLQTAIENFLNHFEMQPVYDYRAALDKINRSVERYEKTERIIKEYQEKQAGLSAYKTVEKAEEPNVSLTDLEGEKRALELQKNEALSLQSKYLAQIEERKKDEEKRIRLSQRLEQLQKEKARLEDKLESIRLARECIIKAKGDVATKYLAPVEKASKRYAEFLGIEGGRKWRFNSSSKPIAEENGQLKEMEYYSDGQRALWDLCIRLALVESMFEKEKPVLIFDDSLRDLDDEKTEKGKALIKALSKTYQVLYFTCKTERAL